MIGLIFIEAFITNLNQLRNIWGDEIKVEDFRHDFSSSFPTFSLAE